MIHTERLMGLADGKKKKKQAWSRLTKYLHVCTALYTQMPFAVPYKLHANWVTSYAFLKDPRRFPSGWPRISPRRRT